MNLDALIGDKPLYGFLLVLMDLFLKGILILVGARLLTALLSRSAAAARHLIWATALLMILLLPLFSVILPPVSVPLVPQPFQATKQSPAVHSTESMITVEGRIASMEAGTGTLIKEHADANVGAIILEGFGENRGAGIAAAPPAQEPVEPQPPVIARMTSTNHAAYFWVPLVETFKNAHWTTLVTGVWALGTLFVFGWSLLGITGAWWITRRAFPSEEESWADLNDEIADRLLVYRPVRLLMSSSISSPMTWGIWRPVILLPIDADDWSEERRRYVLLHEMAHIKRWDTLTQFAAQLGCALHWFNPLAWKGLYLLRIEQEKACDDMVLVHGMKASEYARHLLEIARSLKMPWVSPLNTISMAKPSQLEGRVVDILDPRKKKRTMNRLNGVITCVLALSVMLPISALSPWLEAKQDISRSESPVIADAEINSTGVQPSTEPAWATVIEDAPEATAPRVQIASADTSEKQRRARAAAIKALRTALNDEHADVRRHAAMTLGEMNDKGSIEALIKLLKRDTDADVRRMAVIALSELGSDRAVDAYRIAINDKDKDVRRFAVMALADHEGEVSIDALISVLDDPDADIRRFALMGITDHGGARVNDLLIKMLDDEDLDVRRQALMGLADRKEPKALPAIKKALRDSNPEMRRFAIMALSAFEGAESLQLLRIALEDDDSEVRRHALMVIADRNDEASLPIYIEILRGDSDAEVRKYAAMSLGEIGDVEAVEALTKALEDEDAEVRRYAAMALSELDYGDEVNNWEGDIDRDNDIDTDWDRDNNDQWRGENSWEGSEKFEAAMLKLGNSASQFGLAVGELSLNLTSDVFAELAYSLEGLEFEDDQAFLEHDLAMSSAELNEAIYELKNMQFELEEEWSEEVLESILVTIDELEPVLLAHPKLCKQAASIFNHRDDTTKRRTSKQLECGDRLMLRE